MKTLESLYLHLKEKFNLRENTTVHFSSSVLSSVLPELPTNLEKKLSAYEISSYLWLESTVTHQADKCFNYSKTFIDSVLSEIQTNTQIFINEEYYFQYTKFTFTEEYFYIAISSDKNCLIVALEETHMDKQYQQHSNSVKLFVAEETTFF